MHNHRVREYTLWCENSQVIVYVSIVCGQLGTQHYNNYLMHGMCVGVDISTPIHILLLSVVFHTINNPQSFFLLQSPNSLS